MKKYISILVFMVYGFALANPPQPSPPGPPGLSIDSGIIVLFITSILFAIFTINKIKNRNYSN